MSGRLKNCPICGGKPKHWKGPSGLNYIMCSNKDGNHICNGIGNTKPQAIKAWNKRSKESKDG